MLADGLTDAYYSVAGYLKTFFAKEDHFSQAVFLFKKWPI